MRLNRLLIAIGLAGLMATSAFGIGNMANQTHSSSGTTSTWQTYTGAHTSGTLFSFIMRSLTSGSGLKMAADASLTTGKYITLLGGASADTECFGIGLYGTTVITDGGNTSGNSLTIKGPPLQAAGHLLQLWCDSDATQTTGKAISMGTSAVYADYVEKWGITDAGVMISAVGAGAISAQTATTTGYAIGIVATPGATASSHAGYAGGAITATAGAGSDANTTATAAGGDGGAYTATTGAGGVGLTTGAGGIGGTYALVGGVGGASGAIGTGGHGANFTFGNGIGGLATTTGTGGAGGYSFFTNGAGGATATGTAGAGGYFRILNGAGGLGTTTGTSGAGGYTLFTGGNAGQSGVGGTSGVAGYISGTAGNGGTLTAAGTGVVGGAVSWAGGVGSANVTNTASKGGNVNDTGGAGGVNTTAGTGGAGGDVTGTGGVGGVGVTVGGKGGTLTYLAGQGGAGTTGGVGGDVNIYTGLAGAGGSPATGTFTVKNGGASGAVLMSSTGAQGALGGVVVNALRPVYTDANTPTTVAVATYPSGSLIVGTHATTHFDIPAASTVVQGTMYTLMTTGATSMVIHGGANDIVANADTASKTLTTLTWNTATHIIGASATIVCALDVATPKWFVISTTAVPTTGT